MSLGVSKILFHLSYHFLCWQKFLAMRDPALMLWRLCFMSIDAQCANQFHSYFFSPYIVDSEYCLNQIRLSIIYTRHYDGQLNHSPWNSPLHHLPTLRAPISAILLNETSSPFAEAVPAVPPDGVVFWLWADWSRMSRWILSTADVEPIKNAKTGSANLPFPQKHTKS